MMSHILRLLLRTDMWFALLRMVMCTRAEIARNAARKCDDIARAYSGKSDTTSMIASLCAHCAQSMWYCVVFFARVPRARRAAPRVTQRQK